MTWKDLEQGRTSLLRVKGLVAPCGPVARKQEGLAESAGDEPGSSGCLSLGSHHPHLPPCGVRRMGDGLSEQVCTTCGTLGTCRQQYKLFHKTLWKAAQRRLAAGRGRGRKLVREKTRCL